MTDNRATTGVQGLDKMLGGGFFYGDAILVAGSPGTGKTTLGLHFAAAGVAAGENTVYVTFEYLPQQIYRDAAAKGWDLKGWEDSGKVRLLCTTPDMVLAETGAQLGILEDAIRAIGAKRLVIDSMTHFEFLGMDSHDMRTQLSGMMNKLRLIGITTLLTHEIADIVGPAVRVSQWGLEFLVDTVILLRYVELDGELVKACNVLKFRGGDHDRRYRRVDLGQKGMVIEADFSGIEDISRGSARRTVQERARGLI